MYSLLNTLLLISNDPHSKEFKILLIASEIVVTLIVFYGFYLVFNKFNKNLKTHKKENPEINRKKSSDAKEETN
ncbi:MAG: hypothetical protein M0R38_00250 [Bacteroidia bacterium]|nr:hypothetical protein [Bacteroidia bacterium]